MPWTWYRVKRTVMNMAFALASIAVLTSSAHCGLPSMCPIVGSAGSGSENLLGGLGRIVPLLFVGLSSLMMSEGPRSRYS